MQNSETWAIYKTNVFKIKIQNKQKRKELY